MTTAPPFLVGVSSADVTPAVGSFLAGFAARVESSKSVYHPLSCVVTVITDRQTETTAVIASIEWLGFYDWTDQARALIREATGVPESQILLCGTHTHCGPTLRKATDEHRHGPVDTAFLESALRRVARAAGEAMGSRRPARARSTLGWCGLAHSRRRPDGRGGVAWMPTLDAPHDPTVPVLVFEDEAARPLHVIFSYACHPTAAGPILEIGGDYPGFALDRIRELLGCSVSFLLGCAGDQKPYLPDALHPAFPQYPIPVIRQMGERLADCVVQALRFGESQAIGGGLTVDSRRINLISEVQPRGTYEELKDSPEAFLRRWARHCLAALDGGGALETGLPFEVQTLRFGHDLTLVAMAGEMSAEYGLRLVRTFGHRFARVWPVGYANGIVGYVPSARQYPEGGYEVITSPQHLLRPGPLERDTEARIFALVAEMLAD